MAKAPHIKVLLVRSGRNDWDSAGRLSGSADLPLCDKGRDEIRRLVEERLTAGVVAKVYSGPEESAAATASLIGSVAGAKVRSVAQLHEVGLGRWEGMAASDAEGRYASVYRQWREDPTLVVPPGGETVPAAADRLIPVVREVLGRCRAGESCGVCFVLRPMAFGIVRCWLRGEELSGLWPAAESGEGFEWFVVDRSSLRGGDSSAPSVVRDAG